MMKKLSVLLILFLLPAVLFAQQDSVSASALGAKVQELQGIIQQLQAQLAQMNLSSTNTSSVVNTSVTVSPVLTRTLTIGSTGDDVAAVQRFLSADPAVYPEGLVTGYYGPLTAEAVSRYQEKIGLESVGIVGPKTMYEVNKALTSSSVYSAANSVPMTPNGDACRVDLIITEGISHLLPIDMICATVNRNFVLEMDYQGTDGKCYHAGYAGTSEIACNTNRMPPKLPNGQIPSPFDPTFNWSLANGHCYYTTGDTAGAMYGATTEKICGVSSGGGSHVITILKVVDSGPGGSSGTTGTTPTVPPTGTPSTGTSGNTGTLPPTGTGTTGTNTTVPGSLMSQTSNAYLSDPTAINYLGSLVAGGTVSGMPSICDQVRMNTGYKMSYNPNPANPTVDVACRTVGKGWVGSIDYKGSDNMCYHADWTGTYKVDCATLQKITGLAPIALPNNQMPTDIYSSSVNWSAYNTKCYYTTGDTAAGAPYGVPSQVICGAYHGTMSLLPTVEQIKSSTNSQSNPYSTAMNPVGLLIGAYLYDPTAINYLGSLVSGGTVSGMPSSCDQTRMNTGYKLSYNPNPANPTVDVACRTVGKGWVGSIDYKGSDNMCYHADWTGTYKVDCTVIQKIAGVTPTTLPNNQVPTDVYSSSVNWSSYNTKCYYTTGDTAVGAPYGVPSQIICGAYHGFPTQQTTSGSSQTTGIRACSRNTDCNDGDYSTTDLCFGATSYSTGVCSNFTSY